MWGGAKVYMTSLSAMATQRNINKGEGNDFRICDVFRVRWLDYGVVSDFFGTIS
jgi:hypothetical protein